MRISSFQLKNYRRLVDVDLDLGDQKTILVGANNSGKTSCVGALHTFLMQPENLRIRDVSKQYWKSIVTIGTKLEADEISIEDLENLNAELASCLPALDVIIHAEPTEAYRARDILPHLNWNGGKLGVRISYEPEDITKLANEYREARRVVSKHTGPSLWPKELFDFLEKGKNFSKYIKQRYYILGLDTESAEQTEEKTTESAFSATSEENQGVAAHVEVSEPHLQPLPSGALKKLIRVDVISDQRGLGSEDSDTSKGPYSEKQRLNKLLREYYDRFLNPEDFPEAGDLDVLQKQQEMEEGFSRRLKKQFKDPLNELKKMGYPGIGGNPSVEILAKISGADALEKSSSVGYTFDEGGDERLPESYLGLGYQNLIYLTFRLLGFRDRWMRKGKSNSTAKEAELPQEIEPIHLVLVEEPEVNLHAQVQRVFISKAYETLRNHDALKNNSSLRTQLVVSTHSSHVVHDVDFKDLRYFRRSAANGKIMMDHTSIENMSKLFDSEKDKIKAEMKFVSKHLKLTHCDIFFADGVIFLEGQAERLLVPEFISKHFEDLSSRYLSILEVSGAHTHKYRELVERLGVATLIVTDLDTRDANGKCFPQKGQGQTTSNHTLTSWHPQKDNVDELVSLSKDDCENKCTNAPLFVAFQKATTIDEKEILSRTFEDALILSNLDNPHFQKIAKIKAAKETFDKSEGLLEDELFNYVQTLTKGNFAFDCLFYIAESPENSFNPPEYIKTGLEWLQEQLTPKS